jgi:hypothetical protein
MFVANFSFQSVDGGRDLRHCHLRAEFHFKIQQNLLRPQMHGQWMVDPSHALIPLGDFAYVFHDFRVGPFSQ